MPKVSSSSVPAIASGGGGGAAASSVSSVSSGTIASVPPLSGKRTVPASFETQHLFLGGAVCTRGQQCKYVHQRGVKSTRKVDLIDFVEDVAKNDAQLVQLVAAINLKA